MKTDLPPAAGSAPVTSRCTNAAKGSVPFPAIRQPPSGIKDQSGRGAAKKSQLVSPPGLRSPPEPRGEEAGGRRPQAGQQRHPVVGRESVRPARRLLIPKAPGGSCDSGPASLSGDSAPKSSVNSSRTSPVDVPHGGEEMRFTLSLTPEAVLVIQKRNLERQLLSRRKKPAAAAAGSSRSDLRCERPPRDTAPPRPGSPLDIRTLLKISLLNDRHKYDDVEYEEEEEEEGGDEAAGEDVMEKCLEWLKGVESAAAAAARMGADRLVDLPRLSS